MQQLFRYWFVITPSQWNLVPIVDGRPASRLEAERIAGYPFRAVSIVSFRQPAMNMVDHPGCQFWFYH